MKRLVLASFAAALTSAPALAETYHFDPGHTEVRFYYNHAGLTEQSGQWKIVDGTVEFDPADLEATKVSVTIDANSIDTGVEPLDEHLKSADFFETEKHPQITFESKEVKQTGVDSVVVTGDLTIKGKAAPVSLDVRLTHQGEHPLGAFIDYYQGDWIGVESTANILRSNHGVGMFAPVTSDNVRLEISAEMKKDGWE